MPRIDYHGHATATVIADDGTRILIDPFLDDNPASELKRADVQELDFILCTHGHYDHFADTIPLARQTGAMVVSTFEIVSFLGTKGIENVHPLHIGGGHHFPFGYVKMTPALHGGQVAGDDTGAFTTVPGGFWIDFGGKTLYHAGDSALLMEMQLLRGKVDVAMLPIGDNFTMGPEDAARAVEFIQPGVVIPIHYNTWDLIAQDPEHFRALVGDRARVEIVEPGGSFSF
jgi:L-ascorbate metabolism protein UlaG (beta-lactamase superfamily)